MPAELASSLTVSEADRLPQAEALVRSYCGWHIAPSRADATVTLRATGGRVLLLPSLHVTAVAIEENDLPLDTDYYTWDANGVLYRFAGWHYDVTVTFTHGHSTVPPEVQAIVQAVAQRAVDNPGSLVRVQDGPFNETYSQTGFNQAIPLVLLDAEKAILDRYRIPPRP